MSQGRDGGQAGGVADEVRDQTEEQQGEQQAEETLRRYSQESAYRTELGIWKWVVLVLGSALTFFQLYTALRGGYVSLVQGAVHVGGAMGLIYLLYPAKRAWSSRPGIPFYDLILAARRALDEFLRRHKLRAP